MCRTFFQMQSGEGLLQLHRRPQADTASTTPLPTQTSPPPLRRSLQNAALASFGVTVGGLGVSFFLAIFIPGLVR